MALVTGGSRGIGGSVALALAQAGAAVAVVGRCQERAANAAAFLDREAPRRGDGLHHVGLQGDVTDPEACVRVVAAAQDALGHVDILVNAAGVCHDALLARATKAQVEETLSTNLAGPIYMSRAIIKPMVRHGTGGVVLNIGSIIGIKGHAGQAVYSASKAGLTGFTLSLAHELGPRGIRVNQISPGFIDTDMTAALSEERRAAVLEKVPLGSFGEPQDVAELACFLASPAARYITGQVVGVDGGLRL